MKTIQVLGAGCSRCKTLLANAEQAARETATETQVIKIQEIAETLMFEGVRGLPALAIDGEVKVSGRVPGLEEIKKLLV